MLGFGSYKTVNIRSEESDRVDLSHAHESKKLSGTGYDEATKLFWTTMDRVQLKSPAEIIQKILDTHGFIVNLENTLACLDSFSLGIRAKVDENVLKNQKKYIVQSYMTQVSFILPHKKSTGKLLKEFYEEISMYEEELHQYRQIKAQVTTGKDKKKSNEELHKEIAELRLENQTLKNQLSGLSKHNLNLREQFSSQEPEGEQLPENIRLASVRSVILNEKIVSIKMGKSNLTVPLQACHEIPNPGEPCLINIEQGVVKNVYFYNNKNPFKKNIAEVLHQSDGILKLRDQKRRQWIVEATTDTQTEKFQLLKRGQTIIFRSVEDTIIDIDTLEHFDSRSLAFKIQENIYKRREIVAGIQGELGKQKTKSKSKGSAKRQKNQKHKEAS